MIIFYKPNGAQTIVDGDDYGTPGNTFDALANEAARIVVVRRDGSIQLFKNRHGATGLLLSPMPRVT